MAEKRRLTWFIVARMIVVTLFYASTAYLFKQRPDSFDTLNLSALGKLVGTTYLFSLISLVILRLFDRFRSLLTYTQIIWDLLLVTTLILLTGGISSPYSFIYMLAIISASVLLARRQAFYAASLCAILYGGIIDLQYYGKLIPLGLSSYPAQQYGSAYILYTIFVNIVAFYLTALLTGYLAERAKSSESALIEKAIDIRLMEEELKRADRLAAVGELAARIAHEIRNPLASISGSVQLIAQGKGIPDSDRRLLDIVLRETDRLNTLISDFLVYARPVSIKNEGIRLKDLYVQMKALLSVDQRFADITLIIECDDGILITADRFQLEQVYWNLFVNSAEAMPGGGTITVTVSPVHLQGKITDQKDFIRIDVSDTGHGMEEEEARHLFEPFFTTKPGGTGLGLATVYRIIKAHGGRIFVDSKPGNGTTISMLLPAG